MVDRHTVAVEVILETLSNRRGFDDWWLNIDPEIQEEIRAMLKFELEMLFSE